jgi:hypothetical protein
MAHWAELDKNNIVLRVTVGNNNDHDEGYQWLIDNLGGTWVKTSYNTRGGIHYGSDGKPDNGVALRKNFGLVGYLYDLNRDAFYAPQPYPSWILNEETCLWEAPTPMPTDGKIYIWDEPTKTWVEQATPTD